MGGRPSRSALVPVVESCIAEAVALEKSCIAVEQNRRELEEVRFSALRKQHLSVEEGEIYDMSNDKLDAIVQKGLQVESISEAEAIIWDLLVESGRMRITGNKLKQMLNRSMEAKNERACLLYTSPSPRD